MNLICLVNLCTNNKFKLLGKYNKANDSWIYMIHSLINWLRTTNRVHSKLKPHDSAFPCYFMGWKQLNRESTRFTPIPMTSVYQKIHFSYTFKHFISENLTESVYPINVKHRYRHHLVVAQSYLNRCLAFVTAPPRKSWN